MNIGSIVLIVLLLVVLYIAIRYIVSDPSKLTTLSSGTEMTTINSTDLAKNSNDTLTSNFTYSIWFYVNDWNYRYGEPKVIFGRMASLSASTNGSIDGVSGSGPCPLVSLGPISNNIDIAMTVYPGIIANSSTSTIDQPQSQIDKFSIPNIPIQKWVNLLISAYGRSLDVYIDGKLVKTCLLNGISKINNSSNVYVTPKGGFSGWTAKFQYFPNSTDPQTAWNIYRSGYGQSMLNNIFGKYQIKVSLVDNGTEESSSTLTI